MVFYKNRTKEKQTKMIGGRSMGVPFKLLYFSAAAVTLFKKIERVEKNGIFAFFRTGLLVKKTREICKGEKERLWNLL